MNNKKKNILHRTVFVLIIILSWDFAKWIFDLHRPYGRVFVFSSEFQVINNWLPLLRGVVQGHLFPYEPSVNPESQAILFYPYLSL